MSSCRLLQDEPQMQRKPTNFARTCNLLSQYMKHKGNLRDLNIEIDGKVENLEALVKPRSSSNSMSASATTNVRKDKGKKSVENELCKASNSSIILLPDASLHKPASQEAAAPLTIFYSGKVLVFNDYPANMVEELLAFAKKGSSRTSCAISSYNFLPTSSAAAPPGSPLKSAGISSDTFQEKIFPAEVNNVSAELRIARRTSIHKFLEKRKDRTAARGPYHHEHGQEQHDLPSSSSSKRVDLKL